MGLDHPLLLLDAVIKVFLIDLMLSADNAVVIALACRRLAKHHQRRVMLMGTGAAVVLRLVLAGGVGMLLALPGLKLIGAAALLWVAVKLVISDGETHDADIKPAASMRAALWQVVVADLVMSLDNVIALAGVSQGNMLVLGLGVAISVPLLMWGSTIVGWLLNKIPVLVLAGGGLLGWIAGDLAISDRLSAPWAKEMLGEREWLAPLACTIAVVLVAESINRSRRARRKAQHRAHPSGQENPSPQPSPQGGEGEADK